MKDNAVIRCRELTELCQRVRELADSGDYNKCSNMICKAMAIYPDAPQPHNLMGLILEAEGDHSLAMKHFRAAWALDPTYTPANQNLTKYGTFWSGEKDAYDECDCHTAVKNTDLRIDYDAKGVGHVVRSR